MTPAAQIADIVTGITEWAKQPYRNEMNLGGWFLFLGMVSCLGIAWGIVLHDIKR